MLCRYRSLTEAAAISLVEEFFVANKPKMDQAETEVCPSEIIIRDNDARNEEERKSNKYGGSTLTG